ncbi:MAG TPA: NADH-ubiquinone oxidoreductase-F iron-sulfur binding region domain-containing protein [Gaiellaceae bacterium]|nr:NADH-ubiquinone oxidoreductase-F iron-sulfur binding region domain-containing protein [Gaiellaceae bacterium]
MPDLRLLNAEPSDAERFAIDNVLGAANGEVLLKGGGRTARDDRTKRHLLLPALRAAQQRVGWVSEGALGYASRRLAVPPAEAYGVASFYALIALEERPADVTHVCTDLSCMLKGATVPEGAHPSPCLGLCERAPASYRTIAGEQPVEEQIPAIGPPLPQAGQPGLRLLRRIAAGVDPESIDAYIQAGGFESLRYARELGPEAVLREVTESRLLGRGGAAFPTGVKWEAVAKQPALPHYIVCNADESEPGTFKDRVLMEQDPFALIESMAVAALATGSSHGFIYVRAEYPLAHRRLQNAIDLARSRGFLEGFDIELRIGAGAYVCGEETALFQSIEGFRGEPRNKPPFPVEVGLHGKPTAVNNVETLFNVLEVVTDGGEAFAGIGTKDSTGTRLFCLSGAVARPGLYELPFGATLRELLDLAGAEPPKAVLLGGAAGAFVGPDLLDLRLTYEDTRAAGVTLGSGVVIVYDESADLVGALLRIAEFFRDESCGQCVPCRVGTVRQEEALKRLAAGRPHEGELQTLAELAQVMQDASICGLGQTAANAVASAIVNLRVFAA